MRDRIPAKAIHLLRDDKRIIRQIQDKGIDNCIKSEDKDWFNRYSAFVKRVNNLEKELHRSIEIGSIRDLFEAYRVLCAKHHNNVGLHEFLEHGVYKGKY